MRTGRGVVTLTTIGIVFAIVFALSSFDTPALAASTTITSLSCAPPSLVVMTDTTSQCTARISGAEGTISGETVTFSQTGGTGGASFTSSKTCGLSATSCAVAVTGSSLGQVILQASYAGDANNAASSGTASVTVVQGTTTTSVSCAPPLAEGAMQFEVSLSSPCTATVSGWGGMISGEVVYFSQTGGTGTVTLPSPASCALSTLGGVPSCQITVTGSSVGDVTIEAAYRGDTDNVGSSGATTFTVRFLTTVVGRPFPPIVTTMATTTTAVSPNSFLTVGPTSATTSTNQSSTQFPYGGFGSSKYLILTAVAVVLVAFGAMTWRRRSIPR